jgi:SAP domain/3'-5' exonuclease
MNTIKSSTHFIISIHFFSLFLLLNINSISGNSNIGTSSSSNSKRFRTTSVTNLLKNGSKTRMNHQQQQCKKLLLLRRRQQQQKLGHYNHFYNQPIIKTTTTKTKFLSSCQYNHDTSSSLLNNVDQRHYYTTSSVPWITTTTTSATTKSLAFASSSSLSSNNFLTRQRTRSKTIQSLLPVFDRSQRHYTDYHHRQLHSLHHNSIYSELKQSLLFTQNHKHNEYDKSRYSISHKLTRRGRTSTHRLLSTRPIIINTVDEHDLDDSVKDVDYDLIEEMLKDQETILQQQQQTLNNANNIDKGITKIDTNNGALDDTNNTPEHSTIDSNLIHVLEEKGIKSRPKPNGNWDPKNPLKWSEHFGRRSYYYENSILKNLIQLQPGDDGYYDVSDITVKGCTIVRTKEQAQIVLKALYAADPSIFHACDTEVMDIDLKSVGPVGNGYVTCLSMYSGPDFDYGLGDGPGTALFIDNLDDSCGLLQEFKDWFENEKYLKVWHNYGFDRHVMYNEGINVLGFGGDTMHMARLLDTSRKNGYSLESLSNDLIGKRKKPMKEIFGIPRTRKDGSAGNIIDLPPVEVLQRTPKYRKPWIRYSCYDAESTWNIRSILQECLEESKWSPPNGFTDDDTEDMDYSNNNKNSKDNTDSNNRKVSPNLYQYYQMHMRPFGEVLTDMERRGVRVDAGDYLANVEVQARKDREYHLNVFRQWAKSKIGTAGLALNVASALQMRIFLFGGSIHPKTKHEVTERERTFPMTRDEIPDDAYAEYQQIRKQGMIDAALHDDDKDDPLQYLEKMKATELKIICKEYGIKQTGTKTVLMERIREHYQTLSTSSTEDDPNGIVAGMVSIEQGDGFDKMKKQDLMDAAIARGLPTFGTKKDIIERIRLDIKELKELDAAIAGSQSINNNNNNNYSSGNNGLKVNALLVQAAGKNGNGELAKFIAELKAKENVEPKYTDVTIKSIGLSPEKFTAGGVPSVTSDVLRTLAGDPFADPPKRGTVRLKKFVFNWEFRKFSKIPDFFRSHYFVPVLPIYLLIYIF